jgi:uncharacterized protein with HEPN domain
MSSGRQSERRNDWRLRIKHILSAISEIETFVSGMDDAAFRHDTLTVRAVSYNFVMIGEAARHIPTSVEQLDPRIPWPRMRGMRNVVAHEYHRVDPDELWKTITQDLETLAPLLEELLGRAE